MQLRLASLERLVADGTEAIDGLARRRDAVAATMVTAGPDAHLFAEASLPEDGERRGVVPVTAAGSLAGFVAALLGVARRPRGGTKRDFPPVASPDDAPGRRAEPVAAVAEAGVADLAEAVAAAGIARVVVVGEAGIAVAGAVAIARALAGRGEHAVLLGSDAKAVCDATGVAYPTDDVMAIAGDPTTFAHSIHRDRGSGAHVLSVLFARDERALNAAGDALDVLALAYDRTVFALGEFGAAEIASLTDRRTALVLAAESGRSEDAAVLARLAAAGIVDAVIMTVPRPALRSSARSAAA
jgi:hypothetical protein